MRLAVDRPRPVDFEHRGVSSKIAPKWDSDDNDIPEGVFVYIDHPEWEKLALLQSGPFSSFEEAVEAGKLLAANRIDRLLD